MADVIQDKLKESAAGPKRVRGDAGEVEQHPIKDLIELDKHLKSTAASKAGAGILFRKLVPGGAP